MSESAIDKLIAEHCGDGVEFKSIGEFCQLVRGNGMPKSDFSDSGVGCIHYGQIYTYYGTWATETVSFIPEEKARKLAKVDPGDLIVTNTSEDVEGVCKAVAWLGEEQVVTGGHATVLKHDQDAKYISYYLQTPQFFTEKKKHATGAKVIDVSAKNLSKIRIPVPPLEVQREIVAVLDRFTALEARRRQYQHYRDDLLTFADAGASWMTLGEVGKFHRGRRFTKADYASEGIACIHYGDIYTEYGVATADTVSHVRSDMRPGLRFAKPGNLVIAGVGETVEDVAKAVAWLGTENVAIHDDCFAFDHSLEPKFVSYYFQTAAFIAAKARYVARAKVKRISAQDLRRIPMPVPPPEVQQEIVAVLDRFTALEAELEARRRQYQYYRDRLLSFRECV